MPATLPSTIEAGSLLLRPWARSDVAAMAAAIAASVEHLRPFMPWVAQEPLSLHDRRELIVGFARERQAGGDAVYGAFRRSDGAVVGGCGLHRRRGPGVLEIGYWVHVDHVRRGHAAAMAAALTSAAFGEPGIERVEIHHDRANVASAGVPRRLGFTLVGERPDEVAAPGEEGVDCAWAIDAPAWAERQSQLAGSA